MRKALLLYGLIYMLCFAQPLQAATPNSPAPIPSSEEVLSLMNSGLVDEALTAAKQRFDSRQDCAVEYLFYASMLQSAGEITLARQTYQQFLERFPNHTQAGMAKASIAFLTKELEDVSDEWQQKLSPGDFYLVDTVRNGAMKWELTRMPLKVFIGSEQSGKLNTKSIATKACNHWQTASGGFVMFSFVNAPDQSDIEIHFTNNPAQPEVADRQGTTSYKEKKGVIQHVSILILTHEHTTNTELPMDLCLQDIAHEVGHGLGLRHSKTPGDVMYPCALVRNASNPISKNDIEMLKLLYSSKPDELTARAIAALDKAEVKHDVAYLNMQDRLARSVDYAGDRPKAAKLYERLYSLRMASSDSDVKAKALADLRSAARNYYNAKDYQNAQRCYASVCQKLQEQHDDSALAKAMDYLAYCCLHEGKYSDLEDVLNKQLAVLKKLGDHGEQTATCYQRFGQSYEQQKMYKEAIGSFAKAVEVFDNAGVKDRNAQYCRDRLARLSEYADQFGKTRANPQSDPDGYHSFATFDQWYLRNRGWMIKHPDDAKAQSWMPKLDDHYGTPDFDKINEMLKTRGIVAPEESAEQTGIWTRP